MNTSEGLSVEGDFNQITKSSGLHRQPWLVAQAAAPGVRFTRFERVPVNKRYTQTRENLLIESPPRPVMPGIEELKDKWPQYVAAARIAWGEITEDELLNLKNHSQQLAGLIHDHYSVTREEADMQVRRFFAKHHF
jgi:uncharacterized protein YjbJ (UPF0337 family)